MARPQKKGLDYFPLDVTMDKTDSDIEILEAKYNNGFLILIKLFMKIYQDEGYFIKWGEKESLLLSKRVNVDFNEVNSVINDLVDWGVFDSELFKKFKILTSNRIQGTYIDAVKKRKSVDMINSLILTNDINSNINLVNSDIYPQSKVKKSKGEKSKGEDSTPSDESEDKTLSIEETFKAFWDHYHKTTDKPKKERVAALKHWKKLNLTDQRKAYAMVKPLSLSNIDKDYLPYARTYLANRSFEDEFIVAKPKIQGKETYEQIVSRTSINKRQTF